MAWRFNAGTISPRQSIRWAFWWRPRSSNEYRGIQVVQARPIPMEAVDLLVVAPATLKTSDASVRQEIGPVGYTYFVTVTHLDGLPTEYELVGERVGD